MFDSLTTNGTAQCKFKYLAVRPEPVEGRSAIFSHDQRLSGEISEFLFATATQRGRAATETRNISRKDAKAAKVGVDTYLGNVEQNDSRKIYPAKAPRRKVKKILRILRTLAPWR